MKLLTKLLFLTLITFIPHQVKAGGPLELFNGKPLSFKNKVLIYRYDQGDLGKFRNSEAVEIIEESINKWKNISTAKINIRQNPRSILDINASNYKNFLLPKKILKFTPVIFDNDGSILEALAGVNSSNSIIGVGGPVVVIKDNIKSFGQSVILFNGKFINNIDSEKDPEITTDEFKVTVLHEIGHALGLDHSQINVEAIGGNATEEIKDSVPIMFPVSTSKNPSLKQDDISAISFLYPDEEGLKNFGVIKGHLYRSDGITPVLGANIIGRNINNPLIEATSCISDFLIKNNGEFTLFALPPGKYSLEIEPISTLFAGTSESKGKSVGPYTNSTTDESFIDPVPNGIVIAPNLPVSSTDNENLELELKSGDEINNIDIIGSTEIEENAKITLKIPDNLTINKNLKNSFEVTVNAENFELKKTCRIYNSENIGFKSIPEKIEFDKNKTTGKFKIEIPKFQEDLSLESTNFILSCSNGAFSEFHVNVSE